MESTCLAGINLNRLILKQLMVLVHITLKQGSSTSVQELHSKMKSKMKHKLRYLSILIALPVVFLVSCSQDFLDLDPLGQIAAETTWKDGPLSEAFVTNLYNGLGTGGFDEEMLAALSDEA